MKSHINFVVGHEGLSTNRNGKSAWIYLVVPEWEIDQVKKVYFFKEDDSMMLSVPDVAFDWRDKHVTNRKGTEVSRYIAHIEDLSHAIIVRIISNSGYTAEVKHILDKDTSRKEYTRLLESSRRTTNRKTVVPISNKLTYGVELELSDNSGASRQTVANAIQRRGNVPVVVPQSYNEGKKNISQWKLVRDGSLVCNRNAPDCSKFELVSPILRKEEGLQECYYILKALQASDSVSIKVNKSMGFHVHVGVKNLDLLALKKICWNFVKFEDGIDSFMAPSRRTGGSASNDYCLSCKFFILNPGGTPAALNGGRHRGIEACNTLKDLCDQMNPAGRYHKLNLQNLLTKRQPTIEFRQHSATAQPNKVLAWVRFCVAFVRNSASGPIPEYRRNDFDASQQFEELFDDVIQDQVLKKFFSRRRKEFLAAEQAAVRNKAAQACCGGCARGSTCAGGR